LIGANTKERTMAKSTKKGGAKKAAKKQAPKGKAKGELKDEAVDAAAGGAADTFIWFTPPPGGVSGETKDTNAPSTSTPGQIYIKPLV
jgi:hypothetical protein